MIGANISCIWISVYTWIDHGDDRVVAPTGFTAMVQEGAMKEAGRLALKASQTYWAPSQRPLDWEEPPAQSIVNQKKEHILPLEQVFESFRQAVPPLSRK